MGAACSGPRPKGEEEENTESKPQAQTKSKKQISTKDTKAEEEERKKQEEIAAAKKKEEDEKAAKEAAEAARLEEERKAKEAAEEAERQAEIQRQKELEELKAKQLNEKFTELVTQFVNVLDSDCDGFVSEEELREIYKEDVVKEFLGLADHSKDNKLSVEEAKSLFLTDNEPDCTLVMEATDKISRVKEIRARRKAKRERDEKLKVHEDRAGDFLSALNKKLDGTVTVEELKLVYTKPLEPYSAILVAASTTQDAVAATFMDGDTIQTDLLVELTEALSGVQANRQNEKDFDEALGAFFNGLESLDLVSLKSYFRATAKEVMDALDANNDGVIDKTEMKTYFKKEDGTYDIQKLKECESGLGDAVGKKREDELMKAKQEFESEVALLQAELLKLNSSITLEELTVVMPDSASKYLSLVNIDNGVSDVEAFLTAFQDGETYDKPQLMQLKESVASVMQTRVEAFYGQLQEFSQICIPNWLKKLDVEAMSAQCANQAENYAEIVGGKADTSVDALKSMFVVNDMPDYDGFKVINEPLIAIEKKAMKKFDKAIEELKKHIDEFCNAPGMGTFTRQNVFQVYIDEARVPDFDKRWVKKLLNKPIDELPGKAEMRKLFTPKKKKEPEARLVKGLLKALQTLTDRRRVSIKQEKLLMEANYEAALFELADAVEHIARPQRIPTLEALGEDVDYKEYAEIMIKQIKEQHNGKLKMEELKPVWISQGEDGNTVFNITTLADITNQIMKIGKELMEAQEEEVKPQTDVAADKRTPNRSLQEAPKEDVEEEVAPKHLPETAANEEVVPEASKAEPEPAAVEEVASKAEPEPAPAEDDLDEFEEAAKPEPVPEEPVTSEPVAKEPEAPEPAAKEPEAPEPVAKEPEAPEPVAKEPEVPEPVTKEPEAPEPAATEPEAPEPVAKEPEAPEPAAKEPEASEPAAKEPEAPAATEPEAAEPVAKEPEAPKPATTEPEAAPEVKEPEAPKPATTEPEASPEEKEPQAPETAAQEDDLGEFDEIDEEPTAQAAASIPKATDTKPAEVATEPNSTQNDSFGYGMTLIE